MYHTISLVRKVSHLEIINKVKEEMEFLFLFCFRKRLGVSQLLRPFVLCMLAKSVFVMCPAFEPPTGPYATSGLCESVYHHPLIVTVIVCCNQVRDPDYPRCEIPYYIMGVLVSGTGYRTMVKGERQGPQIMISYS